MRASGESRDPQDRRGAARATAGSAALTYAAPAYNCTTPRATKAAARPALPRGARRHNVIRAGVRSSRGCTARATTVEERPAAAARPLSTSAHAHPPALGRGGGKPLGADRAEVAIAWRCSRGGTAPTPARSREQLAASCHAPSCAYRRRRRDARAASMTIEELRAARADGYPRPHRSTTDACGGRRGSPRERDAHSGQSIRSERAPVPSR